ncbi:MAG: hypothetical protein NWQ43_14570, partial [Dolichospermum sp.]|nr:hypothetical protein [Dolichospermum sp.]
RGSKFKYDSYIHGNQFSGFVPKKQWILPILPACKSLNPGYPDSVRGSGYDSYVVTQAIAISDKINYVL